MSQTPPVQPSPIMASSSSELKQLAECLRQSASEPQLQCYELLLSWVQMQQYSGPFALPLNAADSGQLSGLTTLVPCDIVTQWGSRHHLLLLLPVFARDSSVYQHLLQLSCDYIQDSLAHRQPEFSEDFSEYLGLLTFSHNRPQSPNGQSSFCPAWQYTVTLSFPIAEEAVWLLPLQENELQRFGGEVELPRQLGEMWNCAL